MVLLRSLSPNPHTVEADMPFKILYYVTPCTCNPCALGTESLTGLDLNPEPYTANDVLGLIILLQKTHPETALLSTSRFELLQLRV